MSKSSQRHALNLLPLLINNKRPVYFCPASLLHNGCVVLYCVFAHCVVLVLRCSGVVSCIELIRTRYLYLIIGVTSITMHTASSAGMKSFFYCFLGTIISLFSFCYSFYVPWALVYLDMNEVSFMVKVPVLLWQGCFYDNHSCIISSLVDTTAYPTLSFDPTTLALFSNILLVVCFLHLLGICLSVVACGVHLLDMYKIRMMLSSMRFVYPTAVGCFLLSLLLFFPTLAFHMQGGFFLSG